MTETGSKQTPRITRPPKARISQTAPTRRLLLTTTAPPAQQSNPQQKPSQLNWLVKTAETITTTGGHAVDIWELQHQKNEEILSSWAKHLRNHYCLDEQIDQLRKGTGLSRKDYLTAIKFPDAKDKPGPSIRSGDFSEILVSDYVEFLLGYWVPRTRYGHKTVRNESTKGCDIIGFKFAPPGQDPKLDALAFFESKADLSSKTPSSRLQDAVTDSAKDITRKPESLNAIKQRFLDTQKTKEAENVERFQDPIDRPYQETYGAAAILIASCFDKNEIAKTNTTTHPAKGALKLIIIRGSDLMPLVHDLYERAANEA